MRYDAARKLLSTEFMEAAQSLTMKEWNALLNRVAVLERQMERLGAPQYRLVYQAKR
jgi:hypothetical protein